MISRAHRSQSVMSSVSLQDSQLQFYDAIEYFTSDSESDDDSEDNLQETSDVDANDTQSSSQVPLAHARRGVIDSRSSCKLISKAIVPGRYLSLPLLFSSLTSSTAHTRAHTKRFDNLDLHKNKEKICLI